MASPAAPARWLRPILCSLLRWPITGSTAERLRILRLISSVKALRDEKRADVVVLIVDDASSCGLATRVAADAEEAFAVVHHACAVLTYSVPHEIGHIIGARHEHGYVNGTKWRDIMSYKSSCGGCPRLAVWSNPTIKIQGEPAGTTQADNARVILEQAERVSKFRS